MPAPFPPRPLSRRARQVRCFSAAARARAGGALGLAGLLVGSGALCRAAWAQPPESPSFAGRGTLTLPEQFQRLRRTLGALEVTQPQVAIEEYQAFSEERGVRDGQVTAGLTSVIAQIWWRELKNKDKALEVYDRAIESLGQDPWAALLRQEREQLAAGTLALSLAPVTLPDAAGAEAGDVVAPVNPLFAVLSQTTDAGANQVRAVKAPSVQDKAADRALVGVDVLATPDRALGAGALTLATVAAPSVPGQAGVVALPSAVVNAGRVESWAATLPLPVGPALQVGPTSRSAPSLVGALEMGNVSLVPGQGAAALKNIAQVNEKSLLATTVVAQIAGGTLSAEQAWQNGSLTVEGVYDFFEHQVNPWGEVPGQEGQSDNRLRLSMAGVLANHGGERLKDLSKVPLPVRVWLADYFQNQGDARVLTWGESVLDELKAPQGEAQERLAFQAIERMGWFYRDQGQYEKGAQNWLRLLTLLSPGSLSQPDARIEAARLYTAAGQTSKARELYAQVPKYGQGWFSALALYDQALPLMGAGKVKEAYALMSQPLQFTENADSGVVAQQAWLASFAYQLGDLDAAMKHGRAALDAGSDGSKLSSKSVHNLYDMARDIYNRAGGWRTQPIQSDTKEVVFQANPSQPGRTLYARFRIKTYGDTSVTATVDDPAFQARVLPLDNWKREGLNAHEQEMEVVVQTSLNRPVADVPLVLSSAARGKTTTVRLSLSEESPRPAPPTGG